MYIYIISENARANCFTRAKQKSSQKIYITARVYKNLIQK